MLNTRPGKETRAQTVLAGQDGVPRQPAPYNVTAYLGNWTDTVDTALYWAAAARWLSYTPELLQSTPPAPLPPFFGNGFLTLVILIPGINFPIFKKPISVLNLGLKPRSSSFDIVHVHGREAASNLSQARGGVSVCRVRC